MNCHNRGRINACDSLGVIISLFVGTLVGVLFALNFISVIRTFIWIAFGLGVLTLIFIFVSTLLSAHTRSRELIRCSKKHISCLLTGTIGTIIAAIIALSTSLIVTILISAIVAIVAFFFTLMIIGIIAYILCIICELPEN